MLSYPRPRVSFQSVQDPYVPARRYKSNALSKGNSSSSHWSKKSDKERNGHTRVRRHSVGSITEYKEKTRPNVLTPKPTSKPAGSHIPKHVWGFYHDHTVWDMYGKDLRWEEDSSRQAGVSHRGHIPSGYSSGSESHTSHSLPSHLMDFYKSTTVWEINHKLDRDRIYNNSSLNNNQNSNYRLPSGKSHSLDPHLWRTNHRTDLVFQTGTNVGKAPASVSIIHIQKPDSYYIDYINDFIKKNHGHASPCLSPQVLVMVVVVEAVRVTIPCIVITQYSLGYCGQFIVLAFLVNNKTWTVLAYNINVFFSASSK